MGSTFGAAAAQHHAYFEAGRGSGLCFQRHEGGQHETYDEK